MSAQPLAAAREAALAAARIIADRFGRLDDAQVQKKGENDFVTEVDKAAEAAIIETLHRHFPGHQVLAEEGGYYYPDDPYLWVIDPLDGTTNFIQNIPHFSISLALLEDKIPVFGLIYDPILKEMFSAQAGQGSFLNGQPIHVSRKPSLELTLGATGFPFRSHQVLSGYLQVLKTILDQAKDVRRCGSAALDLAYTACGRYDFFWEAFLQPWDFLAGGVIVEEAGGQTGNFSGQELAVRPDSVLAANPALFKDLLTIIQKNFV